MGEHIQYDFLYDNQFAELKESEMIQSRLGNLATIEPYIGKFYSTEYVRKKILRQTDSEIEEIDNQIEDEIQKGILTRSITNRSNNRTTFTSRRVSDLGEVLSTDPDLEAQGESN